MAEDQRIPASIRASQESPHHQPKERNRGPRSLFLKRSENGFGFTLRHFIVYPPESYTVLAGDRRLGLRGFSGDGPMDTIFVKSVRGGSPAALAGLATGDRLVSVNGETTAGRPYAHVIHLIQHSPLYLHLLVVPREEDILQLYFGETAHNPETNQRPGRLRSPECGIRWSPRAYPLVHTRRSSDSSNRGMSDRNGSDYSGSESYSLPGNTAGCRLSLDAGIILPPSHHSPPHHTDDSVIISRIRKSCEQKEEFLKRPAGGVWSSSSSLAGNLGNLGVGVGAGGVIQREFYARPGKLHAPVWPPAIPASQANRSPALDPVINPPQPTHKERGFVYGGAVTNPPGGRLNPQQSGRLQDEDRIGGGVRLDRIEERGAMGPRTVSPPGVPPHQSALHLVSERTRQFEQGKCQVDRTRLYRSELARLGAKRNVPNVAVRRREFENRAADWRAQRESRSLDSTDLNDVESISPPATSGNRADPIGGTKLHCDPPADYHEPSPERRLPQRQRSNSIEGGIISDDTWPIRNKAVRQDSYLAAVKKPVSSVGKGDARPASSCLPEIRIEKPAQEKPHRPTTLDLVNTNAPSTSPTVIESPVVTPEGDSSPQSSPGLDSVVRRNKSTSDDQVSEDERATRRVSYLKATWGDRMHVDSDLELSDTEHLHNTHRRGIAKWRPPVFTNDIQPLRKFFEQLTSSGVVAVPPYSKEDILLEGSLNCKLTQVDGKKAHDRSWKLMWAVLRGPILYLFKDKKDVTSETPVDHERVDLRGSMVAAAEDYTKRRHVLRLSTPSASEILLQADSAHDMTKWLHALHQPHNNNNQTVQTNSTTVVSTSCTTTMVSSVSPVAAHKSIMKLTSFRNRSPTGQSPINKTRKPSQTEVQLVGTSPKSKTWKGRVAKQLRRMQPGAGSPVSPTAPSAAYPDGATIGVPLELCPQSPTNDFVPLLVELCTGIVEARGLEIIGIYRVPGNTAAVQSLKEAVNRGLDVALLDQDQRWSDVNVISSLLKLFFRGLPDCLLTTELYPSFIQADKIDDPKLRIATIRKLVHELPEHHYQTLKHLLFHLKLIVEHSCVNKMEARNLAIVFGPTLIRAADDNMVTMVTDMSHQCRIVETLIHHVDWCYSDDGVECLQLKEAVDHSDSTAEGGGEHHPSTNQTLLLDNIHKVEGMKDSPTRDVSARDIVSSIITAANRKMQKARSRKNIPTSSSTSQASQAAIPVDDPTSALDDKHKGDWKSGGGKERKERIASIVAAGEGESGEGGRSGSVASVANTISQSILFSGNIANKLSSSPHSPGVNKQEEEKGGRESLETKVTAEDGTIRTYAGLSETTQERIRRFEMETKAMLQRDKLEWLQNKRELDTEESAANPTAIESKIAEDGEGSLMSRWKQMGNPGAQTNILTDAIGKRLKTGNEMSLSAGSLRRGSLDSLKDSVINDRPHSNLSDESGYEVVQVPCRIPAWPWQ